jgi:hypothetical protein
VDVALVTAGVLGDLRGVGRASLAQRAVEAQTVTDDDIRSPGGGAEVADKAAHERLQGVLIDGSAGGGGGSSHATSVRRHHHRGVKGPSSRSQTVGSRRATRAGPAI